MKNDAHYTQKLREKVQQSSWPTEKKNAFLDYQNYLEATGKSARTKTLYSLHVHRLGEFAPKKQFANYTDKDIMAYKTKLSEKYAPKSVHCEMLDLITFLKWHMKLEGKPECMKWYDVSEQNKKVVKKLNPKDVLTPEDILALVSSCGSKRNKAIVFCLWESGCRIQEFLDVLVDDLQISEKVVSVWIRKGKTREAERQVFLIQSAPALMDWLAEHEFRKNKNAKLFYSMGNKQPGGILHHSVASSILSRAAKKAKIQKPVNPHALRKSRATFMAQKGYGDQMMRQMFGWSANSPMPSFYSSLSGDAVKMALMQDAGIIKKEETGQELAPIPCPYCKTTNSADAAICKNLVCSRPLTMEGITQDREQKAEAMRQMMHGEITEAIAAYLRPLGVKALAEMTKNQKRLTKEG